MTQRKPLVLITGTVQELPAGDAVSEGVAADFGDGTSTSFDIAHNLNSLDVEVQFRRNTVPRTWVLIQWEALDVNTIRVVPSNAPAVNELRAMVKRAG